MDNATQDIDTNRQITAFQKMLVAVANNKALLVGRLNWVELRKLKKVQNSTKKTKE